METDMKRSLILPALIVIALLLSQSTQAQDLSSYKKTPSDSLRLAIDVAEFHEAKIMGMQHCFRSFYSQYTGGIMISLTGVMVTPLALLSEDPTVVSTGLIVGGAVSLIGAIICLDSFKWLNRAGVSPADYGVGFKVRLHK